MGKEKKRRVRLGIWAALLLLLGVGLARGSVWFFPEYDMGVPGESMRMCASREALRWLRGAPDSTESSDVTGSTTLSYSDVRVFDRACSAEYEFYEGALLAARYEIPAGEDAEALFASVCDDLWRSGRYARWEDGGETAVFATARGGPTGIDTYVERRDHCVRVEVRGCF